MSIVTRYWLHCDGCGRVGPRELGLIGHASRTLARKMAKRDGWFRHPKGWSGPPNDRRWSDGVDLCPTCDSIRTLGA
jgi:hypothetical protein